MTTRRAGCSCGELVAKGKAVDFKELLWMEPDSGTANISNVKSKHWTRWLGVEKRCVVPFNSFSEFNKAAGGDIWFALDETRPLRDSPATLLRRHLEQLDVGPKGQGRQDHKRPLCVPDDGAQRRSRRRSSERNAGDPEDAR